jgi:hypothetical protein
MDGKDIFRIGFIFGKGFAKKFRRNNLFYDGFINGWVSHSSKKSLKEQSKYRRLLMTREKHKVKTKP